MGRLRWFMAGAGAAAGALVAAPGAYQRLRTLVQPVHRPELPRPRDEPSARTPPDPVPAPATAFAAYDAPPLPDDEETAELRLRIDETRDRIRRRAGFGEPADGGAPPEGDAPPQAG